MMMNNMQAQQPYYNFGAVNYAQPAGGMTYGQPMNIPANNLLSNERIKELLKNGNGLPQIQFTQADLDKAHCCHRDGLVNKTIPLPNGMHKCEICGEEFNIVEDATMDELQLAVQNVVDIMNTGKMMWLNIPQKLGTEFFSSLMAIKKIPEMYAIASSQFNKYTGNQSLTQQAGNGFGGNGFAMLGAMLGAPAGYNMYQQPMYPQQQMMSSGYDAFGNPIYPQQQVPQTAANMQQAQMTAAAPGVSNGMGYVEPNLAAQVPQPAVAQQTAPADNTGAANVTQTLHV